MERDRSARVIAIVALLIAVVGLSIGFAAFSDRLTIKSSAEITPDETAFDVNFSRSNEEELDGVVSGSPSDSAIVVKDAVIDNSNSPVISNLGATFTEPGQSVTYSFYAHNNGKYKAFLNKIDFLAVENETAAKVCKPKTNENDSTNTADATMVAAACEGISVSVKVGNEALATGTTAITGHVLDINKYEPVVVTISYAPGSEIADGDFSVEFGDIVLNYDSVQK